MVPPRLPVCHGCLQADVPPYRCLIGVLGELERSEQVWGSAIERSLREAARIASPRRSWDLAAYEFLPQRRHDLGLGRGLGQATGEAVVLLRSDGLPQVGDFLDP